MSQPTNPNFCMIDGCTNRTHTKNSTRCGRHLNETVMSQCAVEGCENEFPRTQGSRRLCDDHRGYKLPRVCSLDGCNEPLPPGGRKYCQTHSDISRSSTERWRLNRKQKRDEEGQPLYKRQLSEKEHKAASADAIQTYLANGGKVTKCRVGDYLNNDAENAQNV